MIPNINKHRKVVAENEEYFNLLPPFSFFDFIEERFGYGLHNSIRRFFSLARAANAKTLLVETIPCAGIVSEENEDLKNLYPEHKCTLLYRLSFWNDEIVDSTPFQFANKFLLGYSILKKDTIPDKNIDKWHIFEAVFRKYPHRHNCTPRPQKYNVRLGQLEYEIEGTLYCQQNALNKACAQVALRSLLSRLLPDGDISYRKINNLAKPENPGSGLSAQQIQSVLSYFQLQYQAIDYTDASEDDAKETLPYQKFIYSGIESGSGALVGFKLSGSGCNQESRHIIPLYGHTFNKDTWAPNADISYFNIGDGVGYIPSESWTSSFIGHDDNFGQNFCIPRLYINPENVDYVVEIFRQNVSYSGVIAEAISLDILYSILGNDIGESSNKWISRMKDWTRAQQIIFRALALTSKEYTDYLGFMVDWEGNKEDSNIIQFFKDELPNILWVVEISTPHLFPANQRKLGEIVLDASMVFDNDNENSLYEPFLFARIPGSYLYGGEIENSTPELIKRSSFIKSHTELITV